MLTMIPTLHASLGKLVVSPPRVVLVCRHVYVSMGYFFSWSAVRKVGSPTVMRKPGLKAVILVLPCGPR